jgi:hypothetical protein
VAGNVTVAAYLADPATGLVSGSDFRVVKYRPSFSLDAIGQPSIGVTAGGYYGTGVAGGISALWGDQLGDRQIFSAVEVNGTVKDFAGALYYQNLKHRMNWLAGAQHIPYVFYGGQFAQFANGVYDVNTILTRLYVDQLSLSAQYPLSSTKRFEVGVSGTRLGFEDQIIHEVYTSNLQLIGREIRDSSIAKPLYYAQPTAAFVGDNTFGGFTSPISGTRYRLEITPTVGDVVFNSALADFRKYFFARPLTFAFRGLQYGRYGRDADDQQKLSPIYLGDETLIRGYGYGSIQPSECITSQAASTHCPVFERMFGSKIGVFNAELRIPVFGTTGFGLLNVPFLPLEVSPFFDAGIAWMGGQSPDFSNFSLTGDARTTPASCAANSQSYCAQRIPVFSTGVSFRLNVLGYMILETYVAHPFQRPTKSWVVGVQLAPGW